MDTTRPDTEDRVQERCTGGGSQPHPLRLDGFTSHVRCLFLSFSEFCQLCDFCQLRAVLLARDVFVRTNHRAIAMMFVRLSVCLSVCLSVWNPGTGVHCGHTVHFSADLSL